MIRNFASSWVTPPDGRKFEPNCSYKVTYKKQRHKKKCQINEGLRWYPGLRKWEVTDTEKQEEMSQRSHNYTNQFITQIASKRSNGAEIELAFFQKILKIEFSAFIWKDGIRAIGTYVSKYIQQWAYVLRHEFARIFIWSRYFTEARCS